MCCSCRTVRLFWCPIPKCKVYSTFCLLNLVIYGDHKTKGTTQLAEHMGSIWVATGHQGCHYGLHLCKSHGDHLGKMGPTSPMWAPYGFCTIDTQVASIWTNWDICVSPIWAPDNQTHTSCPIWSTVDQNPYHFAHIGATWGTNWPDGSLLPMKIPRGPHIFC
jgi:hypothetical protein